MLRFDKAVFFSSLLKPNWSVSLSIKACGSEVSVFSAFTNIVSIFIIALT